jgi:hypothetical protein
LEKLGPRTKAMERNTNLPRFLEEMLRERMQEEEGYRLAMEQYLAQGPQALHERSGDCASIK